MTNIDWNRFYCIIQSYNHYTDTNSSFPCKAPPKTFDFPRISNPHPYITDSHLTRTIMVPAPMESVNGNSRNIDHLRILSVSREVFLIDGTGGDRNKPLSQRFLSKHTYQRVPGSERERETGKKGGERGKTKSPTKGKGGVWSIEPRCQREM